MTRENFVETLTDGTDSREKKLEVVNYYIQHYPVQIIEKNQFGLPTGNVIWTALKGVEAVEGRSTRYLEHAFKALQRRFKDKKDTILK